MDLDDKLRKLLKSGENESCEFKLSLATKDNTAKAICALANTSGGTVVIGIAEKKFYSEKMPPYTDDQVYANEYIIYGVNDDDRDRRELASHLRDSTNFRTSIEKIYRASTVSFLGRRLIMIEVSSIFANSQKLISYKGKVYRRLDNQSVSLNIDELVDLMSASGQQMSFVPQFVQSNGIEDADKDYEDAVKVVRESGKASTSLLQRRMRIGYSRASRLIDRLEADGIVGPANESRPRVVFDQVKAIKIEPQGKITTDESTVYEEAVRVSVANKKTSTSFLQRRLRIGYGRAAKIIELMEQNGIITAADSTGSKPRNILIEDINKALSRRIVH